MTNNIQIPGQISAPKITPSVSSMVEMVWQNMPHVANGLNQIAYMVHAVQQRVAQLQMAELENAYLLKYLGRKLGVELPPIDVIRAEITKDRIEFLTTTLASDDITEEQKAEIKKQIAELEVGMSGASAPVAADAKAS